MPGHNLTRDEAQQRAELLTVHHYDVELDLTDGSGGPGAETFRTVTTVTFDATAGKRTFIDLDVHRLLNASLNGHEIDIEGFDPEVGIELPELAASNTLKVVADGAYTNTGEGLHRFVDPVDGEVYLYSQFETADAHRVYACFDQPDLKATFDFTVTAPAHWEVIANSPATVADGPQLTAPVRIHTFATTQPMSTYITAVCAGPYAKVSDHHDGIDLGLFCRQSLMQYLDAENLFTMTKDGFDWYHRNFALRYPFGKYDQVFCPEYNAGAMENAGCVTILEDYIFRSRPVAYTEERRETTVLHEMAHMWFGDTVTMRWWDDLWLNESFAEFISTLCQSEVGSFAEASWPSFENIEKNWGYRQDQLPSTHPIAADIVDIEAVEVNFDGITYAKGAAVLRQLMAYVGREEFFSGLQEYFASHAFGNATLADLLGCLERSSGRDLSRWSKLWLQTAQVNTITPQLSITDGQYDAVTLLQSAPADYPTLRPHRIGVGLYDDGADGLVLRKRIELDVDGERTEVPALQGEAVADLLLLNDGGYGYTKIRFDPTSLSTVVSKVATVADPLARSLCWQAAWDMVRDAQLSASSYVDMVNNNLPQESVSSLNLVFQRNAVTSLTLYVADAHAEQGWQSLAATAKRALELAPEGSDEQLQWCRTFADSAGSDSDLDLVASILSGATTYPGLNIDTDLRWFLLQRLAAAGRAGEPEIAAELETDNTNAGHRKATTARALLPTAQAKQQAWELIIEATQTPNATLVAAIVGFSHHSQRALLKPYTKTYFEVLPQVWQQRSPEIAQDIVSGLFPSLDASEETVALAEEFLAGDHPAALHRLVSEATDSMKRALRAKKFDADQAR